MDRSEQGQICNGFVMYVKHFKICFVGLMRYDNVFVLLDLYICILDGTPVIATIASFKLPLDHNHQRESLYNVCQLSFLYLFLWM